MLTYSWIQCYDFSSCAHHKKQNLLSSLSVCKVNLKTSNPMLRFDVPGYWHVLQKFYWTANPTIRSYVLWQCDFVYWNTCEGKIKQIWIGKGCCVQLLCMCVWILTVCVCVCIRVQMPFKTSKASRIWYCVCVRELKKGSDAGINKRDFFSVVNNSLEKCEIMTRLIF